MKKFIFISAIVLVALAIFFLIKYISRPMEPEPQVRVYLSEQHIIKTMPLEEYIAGTVGGEMPASFEYEALKAQALCARTFAIRKLTEGKKYPEGADLSDDINTCQAFVSKSEFMKRHGRYAEPMWNKIMAAVKDTRGEIILYDNRPIDALYHSTCGGITESASAVWGNDVPYLQSVKCGFCQDSRKYQTVQVFSWGQVEELLGTRKEVSILETTPSGRMKQVQLTRRTISGNQLRQTLGLPSTWCRLETTAEGLKVVTRGYGHGVGMCQYGAQGMALDGRSYQEILQHYYPGTSVYKLSY